MGGGLLYLVYDLYKKTLDGGALYTKEGSPPQGPSGARRGREVLFLSLKLPRGRPSGGGGVQRCRKKMRAL